MDPIYLIYCVMYAEHQSSFLVHSPSIRTLGISLETVAECPVLSDALLIGVFADGHDPNLYFALLL